LSKKSQNFIINDILLEKKLDIGLFKVFTYPGTTREILLPKFEKNHLKKEPKT
jgi:hypothetical protein